MGGTITVCATRMTWIVVHRRRSKQGQGKDAHKCYAEDDRPWLHDLPPYPSDLHFAVTGIKRQNSVALLGQFLRRAE